VTFGPMAAALAGLRARMGPLLREREILRVSALLSGDGDPGALVRREALRWAEREVGERLPAEAWDGGAFERLLGGRTVHGVRIGGEREVWGLRCDIPDKAVPGRTWTTEVVIGRAFSSPPLLSLRLLATSTEETLPIEPAVPRFLREVARTCALTAGSRRITAEAWHIGSAQDADDLIALLEDSRRALPVLVASGDERAEDPAKPFIDADALAKAVVGLAHVAVVPARFTYALSDAFGKARSVYHGAARIYLPGFDSSADPYTHRLLLPERFGDDPVAILRRLKEEAAKESLRLIRLGKDVVTFAEVREAASQADRLEREKSAATDTDRLAVAQHRIGDLEGELEAIRKELEQAFHLAAEEEERAKEAERRLHYAQERVRTLERWLSERGQEPDRETDFPAAWSEFGDWCDRTLVGRLALTPAARRSVKAARFGDPSLVAKCLAWLANDYRNRRLDGGGTTDGHVVAAGLRNEPCGADSFRFDFQGRKLEADWHIKNGGNTRDPARCLRIYYAWDEMTQQVIVADLPGHRRTAAS
jgi:hypothetical protein